MTDEEAEARERLLFHLENQTGFWFALVIGDDVNPRARLRKSADDWCKEHGRAFVLHEPDPTRLAALAVDLTREPRPGLHWIKADGPQGLIEQWDAAVAQLFLAMNERREAYRKRLDGGVVIEGRDSFKRLLRELAPDLFSIRAFIAEPGTDSKTHELAPSEWRSPTSIVSLSGIGIDPDQAVREAVGFAGLAGHELNDNDRFGSAFMAAGSLMQAKRFDEAERWMKEAQALIEQKRGGADQEQAFLFAQVGLRFMQSLSAAREGKTSTALQCMDAAVSIAETIRAEDDVGALLRMLLQLSVHKLRGALLQQSGDLDGALDAFQVDLRTVGAVLERNPANMEMRLDALSTHRIVSGIWVMKNDNIAAEASIRAALAIAEESVREHPDDERWQLELAQTWRALGCVLSHKDDVDAARDAWKVAISIADKFVVHETASKHWQDERGRNQVLMATNSFERHDFSVTNLPIQEGAVATIARLLEQDPGNVELGWILVSLWLYRAVILSEKEDAVGERDALDHAWRTVERLPVQNKEQARVRRILASNRPRKSGRPKKR